jgi:hypothetical protein
VRVKICWSAVSASSSSGLSRKQLLGEAAGVGRLVEAGDGDAHRPAQEAQPLFGLGAGLGLEAFVEEGGHRLPLVGLLGQALEVGEDGPIGGRQLVGRGRTTGRQRLRVELGLADAAGLGQDLQGLLEGEPGGAAVAAVAGPSRIS